MIDLATRMNPSEEFELDASGNVLLRPIISWTTGTAAGVAVILAVQYADSPDQLQTGGKQIPFVLTPEQALSLSEKLTTLANGLLTPKSDPLN